MTIAAITVAARTIPAVKTARRGVGGARKHTKIDAGRARMLCGGGGGAWGVSMDRVWWGCDALVLCVLRRSCPQGRWPGVWNGVLTPPPPPPLLLLSLSATKQDVPYRRDSFFLQQRSFFLTLLTTVVAVLGRLPRFFLSCVVEDPFT